MLGAIDWILKKFANIMYYLISKFIGTIFGLFNLNSAIVDSDNFKNSVNFFFYDTAKILLMLIIIIFIVSFIRSYFPPEKTKKILGDGKKRGFIGNILAALLGIVTPFCSCSAVPLFIGFVEAGIPLGVTFSFLISSPMVNEVALIMLWGLFGWQIALIYITTGVTVAIISGIIIGKLKLERYVEDYVYKIKVGDNQLAKPSFKQRLADSVNYTGDILKKIWVYIIIGIAIGAVMHGWAPEGILAGYAGKGNPFAVLVAVVIGVPLYSNAAGTIPIIKELTRLGMQMGTALSFMMAVTALSLPEMIILRKVLKPQILAIFIGIMTVTIIMTGYIFNLIIK